MSAFTLSEAQRRFLEHGPVVMTEVQRATLSDFLRSQGHDEGRVALVLDLLSHRNPLIAVRTTVTRPEQPPTSAVYCNTFVDDMVRSIKVPVVTKVEWQLRGYVGDVLRGGGEVTTLATIDESAV